MNLGDSANGFRELEKIAGDYEPARLTLDQAAPQRAALERAALERAALERAALERARLTKSAVGGAPPPRSAFVDERRVARH